MEVKCAYVRLAQVMQGHESQVKTRVQLKIKGPRRSLSLGVKVVTPGAWESKENLKGDYFLCVGPS